MIDPATKNPNMKAEIISWITSRNILPPPGVDRYDKLTKAELIVHSKPHFKTSEKKLEQLIERLQPDVKLFGYQLPTVNRPN